MRVLLGMMVAAAMFGGRSLVRERVHEPTECGPPKGMPYDTLRAIAVRLHPEVLASANRDSSVMVGLLFDADCKLTQHAFGRRTTNEITIDTALARLFPGERVSPRIISGFASAIPDMKPHDPWIVWAVMKTGSPASEP